MSDTDIDTEVDTDNSSDHADTSDDTDITAADDAADIDNDAETFPRSVVEKLRQENGKHRQNTAAANSRADALALRLHTELVRGTGRLADPTDLAFDPEHLDDPDTLTAAIDALLDVKPHLATRRPTGDIGQGNRGGAAATFSLLEALRERT